VSGFGTETVPKWPRFTRCAIAKIDGLGIFNCRDCQQKYHLLFQVENDQALQKVSNLAILRQSGLSAGGWIVAHGFLRCSGRDGEVVEEDPVGGQPPPPLAALPLHGPRGRALPQTHTGRTTPRHTKAATCTVRGAAEANGRRGRRAHKRGGCSTRAVNDQIKFARVTWQSLLQDRL
jgi:hypothetical protein